SLREIVKMTRLSEEYSAAEGGKRLFTQAQNPSRRSRGYPRQIDPYFLIFSKTKFCSILYVYRKNSTNHG
ncbi:MAG: hypothetical protein ACOYOO_14585, partial [Saprospiraceae bacterium]